MSDDKKNQWLMPTIVSILGTALVGLAGVGIAKVERLIDRVETVMVQNAGMAKDIEYLRKDSEHVSQELEKLKSR